MKQDSRQHTTGHAMRVPNLIGQRFGRLVVVARAEKCEKYGRAKWHCVCDCGEKCEAFNTFLVGGTKLSCGCMAKPHGLSGTQSHQVWRSMMKRCHDPEHPDFRLYGGRRIAVCPAWWDVKTFHADFGHTHPGRGFSIERIDNDDGYWLGNVRWATPVEQAANRRPKVVWNPPKTNTSGYLGAYLFRGRWHAKLTVNGVQMLIGKFDTPQEASAAYFQAKVQHGTA